MKGRMAATEFEEIESPRDSRIKISPPFAIRFRLSVDNRSFLVRHVLLQTGPNNLTVYVSSQSVSTPLDRFQTLEPLT
jgi:hypothetical protein